MDQGIQLSRESGNFFPETMDCYGDIYPIRFEERDGVNVLVVDASHDLVAPHTPRMIQIDNSARWHLSKILAGTFDQSRYHLMISRQDKVSTRESKFDPEVYYGFEFSYQILPRTIELDEDELYPAGC